MLQSAAAAAKQQIETAQLASRMCVCFCTRGYGMIRATSAIYKMQKQLFGRVYMRRYRQPVVCILNIFIAIILMVFASNYCSSVFAVRGVCTHIKHAARRIIINILIILNYGDALTAYVVECLMSAEIINLLEICSFNAYTVNL